jgi:putative Mg2+ transporter-C (MgtC) family protein
LAEITALTTGRAILRMVLSVLIGGVVGLEREYHGRAAGFRTHILVSLGCCVYMLVSLSFVDLYGEYPVGVVRVDPARVAYGVVAGVGFLAAGVIMKAGRNVHGLTTAASLWSVAALGLAVGLGLYRISAAGAALTVLTLMGLRNVERLVPGHRYLTVRITFEGRALSDPFLGEIYAAGAIVLRSRVVDDSRAGTTTVVYDLRFRGEISPHDLLARIRASGPCLRIEIH